MLGILLPQEGDVPDRSLVWEPLHFTNNILVPQTRSMAVRDKDPPEPDQPPSNGSASLKGLFKPIRKEKVKSRCDYDKNICGYITKKVIREFVSKNYEKDVVEIVREIGNHCTYAECKAYYLKKVEMVTGPSHMPELF